MTLTQINKAGLDELALDHVFTIGASGSDHYTFQGEGLNGTVNDPTLYLTRGKTYRFENGTGAHPIRIQSTSGASGTAYNTGVTNNAGSGTVIVEVQHDAPDVLYYQCTSHAAMNGVLYITGALADGGVTTAKLAADAVNGTKIADNAVAAEHIAANAVGSSELADNAVDTAAIADDAVTQAKLADNAVQGAIIAGGGIGSGKLAADSVSNTNIIDGNVTSSELATNAVTTAKIADANVTAAKLASGVTDLSNDTSPQLGGNLDCNGSNILLDDNNKLHFGNLTGSTGDLQIYHAPSDNCSYIDTFHHLQIRKDNGAEIHAKFTNNAGTELYYDNTKKFETTSNGVAVEGRQTIQCNADSLNSHLQTTNSSGAYIQHAIGANGATIAYVGHSSQLCGSPTVGNYAVRFEGDAFEFSKSTSIQARITSHGGIAFGSDTAAANTLNDYEEGTWSANSLNYDYDGNVAQRGHYIKIGRMVFATFRLKFHNQTTHVGNHLRFTGLPFTAASGNPYDVGVSGIAHGYGEIATFRIYVQTGSSYAYWYTDTGSVFNNSTALNNKDIRGTIIYTASS